MLSSIYERVNVNIKYYFLYFVYYLTGKQVNLNLIQIMVVIQRQRKKPKQNESISLNKKFMTQKNQSRCLTF